MQQWMIGVDLGGSKTEVILLDGQSQPHFRRRLATPKGDYAATLAQIVALVSAAESAAEQATGAESVPVGVGIPGTLSSRSGRVKNANSTWLNGQRLGEDLQRQLGRPVAVSNDANCLALSEATDGAGQGSAVVFAAILGTGCGAGISVGGQLLGGRNGVAGEWGHNPLPWSSDAERQQRPCFCGQAGCNETFLSGTGLELSYRLAGGEPLAAEQVVARAAAGESLAGQVMAAYYRQLAQALAAVINVLDPQVIVLGGGLSRVEALYREVPPLLARWVLGGECDTPILPARHGDASGVRGAAWLGRELAHG